MNLGDIEIDIKEAKKVWLHYTEVDDQEWQLLETQPQAVSPPPQYF